MTDRLVSVVTISLDDSKGLRRTLESVLRQAHPAIEHIVVDGGSGPEVEALLAQYPHLSHWESRPDGGRYDAMNAGLARATGDLVWFLHSGDTFSTPDAVSIVCAAFDGTRDWWAHGTARLVDAAGNSHGTMGQSDFRLERFILGGRPIPHQATVFSRRLFEDIGDHSLTHGLAADQEFMVRAARRRPPEFIDAVLCDFDISGAGSTRGVHPHFADMRRAVHAVMPMPMAQRLRYLVLSHAVEARAHLALTRHRCRGRKRRA
ncbi:MAG: glycosyltransferase [Gordonia polyisoprenivorans]|nr:glycosyltransferase [Gordonia polyisoprenivorans]